MVQFFPIIFPVIPACRVRKIETSYRHLIFSVIPAKAGISSDSVDTNPTRPNEPPAEITHKNFQFLWGPTRRGDVLIYISDQIRWYDEIPPITTTNHKKMPRVGHFLLLAWVFNRRLGRRQTCNWHAERTA